MTTLYAVSAIVKRWQVSEPRYLMGDDYALNGVEGEEEIGDTGPLSLSPTRRIGRYSFHSLSLFRQLYQPFS